MNTYITVKDNFSSSTTYQIKNLWENPFKSIHFTVHEIMHVFSYLMQIDKKVYAVEMESFLYK